MKKKFRRLFAEKHVEAGLAVLLFVVTLAVFWQARGFGYINLDDNSYVLRNPMVLGGLTWSGVHQAFTTVLEQWWLPFLWISYMADIALWGPGPYGHHWTNILLHAANAGILYWVLFRLTGTRWRSFFVAALFAWHPTRVEAVAWIAARKDVLSGLFFMLALWAYVRHVEKPSVRRMTWVSVAMLAGLMSKAILIVLPVLLLLLDFWPLRRIRKTWGAGAWGECKPLLLEKIPLIVLAAVFMGVNLCTHTTGRGDGAPITWMTRLGMIPPNIMEYVEKVVAPIRLSIYYPEVDTVSWPFSLASLAVLIVVTVLIWRQRDKYPYGIVGWLWFLVALLPILRGVRLGLAQIANRWTYLPLIGLGIALAWVLEAGGTRAGLRRWIAAGCGLVLAVCLLWTHAQLPEWRNSLTVFQQAVAVSPTSHFAHDSLGYSLVERGRLEEGAGHIHQAFKLMPSRSDYCSHWGRTLLLLGHPEESLAVQDQAIRMKGADASFHNHRALALAALGRKAEAEMALREALRQRPRYAEAAGNLGQLLMQMGRMEDALPHCQAAVSESPDTGWMWYNLGMVYAELGRYAEAEPCVRRALALQPGIPGGQAALARIHLLQF